MPEQIKNQLFSKKGVWIYAAIFLFIIFAAYHLADIRHVTKLFRSITPGWMLLAIAAQLCTYVCVGYVYKKLLALSGSRFVYSFKEMYKRAVVILFVNQAIPSGGVSGSAFFVHDIAKRGVASTRAFGIFVMESLTYYIAAIIAIILAAILYIVAHRQPLPGVFLSVVSVGILFFGGLFIFMSIIGSKRVMHFLSRMFSKIKVLQKILTKLEITSNDIAASEANHPLVELFAHKIGYTKVSIAQFGVVALDAVTVFALFAGFHVHTTLLVVFIGFVMTYIVGSLPLSPGSLVVYEGSMTFFYSTLGVPVEAALVVTIVYRVLSFWLPMAVGVFLYRHLDEGGK